MKKTILIAALALFGWSASAQSGPGFGVKGGLNYAGNGDFFNSAENAYSSPDRNIGYHIGVFGKFGDNIYLRPELIYTSTKSGYDEGDLKMNKLDVPVLLGIKVIGPLNVFAGPAFQYIMNTKFDGVTIDDVENDFTVGLNVGAGMNLGKLGIDVRYERGFSDNEITFINSNLTSLSGDRVDTRPDQIIVSLSLKL
ncbi:MAG: porin family protein [Maribacter sp.]